MTEGDHALLAHGVADDRKGFLADRLARHDEVGFVEVGRIDLGTWHEALDLDRMVVLETHRRWRDGRSLILLILQVLYWPALDGRTAFAVRRLLQGRFG